MQNNHTLVTAPKVASSPPSMSYYDPGGHRHFYAQQASPVHRQYLPAAPSLHPTMDPSMAAAAAAVSIDLTSSLPPLSHMLPAPCDSHSQQKTRINAPENQRNGSYDNSFYMMQHPLSLSNNGAPLLSLTPSVRSQHLPSPPTSVIDGVLMTGDGPYTNNNQKVFSFVPLPGVQQKKRPRRKYHEVERLYKCNFQNCTKSYGTLNHLNAHVSMQKHVSLFIFSFSFLFTFFFQGLKRQPAEFKELRKMWRKQKRENKMRQKSQEEHYSNCIHPTSNFIPHWMSSPNYNHHHRYSQQQTFYA